MLQVDDAGNPVLEQFSEEGFVDCVFRIADLSEDQQQYYLRILASYAGESVGMNVTVIKGIQGGFNSEMELISDHVYRPGVQFSRSGVESDRLITALAQLYGLDAGPRVMVESESFTAIALHQGELDQSSEAVRMKIFGNDQIEDESELEARYYESFFHLDLPNRLVYWNEKDPDYRLPFNQRIDKT